MFDLGIDTSIALSSAALWHPPVAPGAGTDGPAQDPEAVEAIFC